MVRTMLPVVAATGVLVAACVGLTTVPNLAEAPGAFLVLFGLAFVAYAAGLWALSALGDSRAFVVTLVVAGACRVVLLPSLPTLSTDAYRYVWDARVASAGISPYAHPPVAPEVARLRDATIHPRLNHPTWLTIYPPAAQAFFRTVYAVAPDSVLAMKIALGATEVVGLVLLVALLRALGLPLARTAIYAWNPLVLVEVWGSAHLDALAVTAVIGAVLAAVRQRHDLAAVVLALGTLVKVYPAALLPLLVRARGVRVLVPFAIVVALGYAPLLGDGVQALGSLPRYVAEEYFNPGLIRSIVAAPAVPLVGMAAWMGWVVWRGSGARARGSPGSTHRGAHRAEPECLSVVRAVVGAVPRRDAIGLVDRLHRHGSARVYVLSLSAMGDPDVGPPSRDCSARSRGGLVAWHAPAPWIRAPEFTRG